MAVGGRGLDVQYNEAEGRRLASGGPMFADLQKRLEAIVQEQKRRCPVSPEGSGDHPSGWMRSHIEYRITGRGGSLNGVAGVLDEDVVPYVLMVEFPTRPHVIESHGDYPLRDRHGNVFGKKVNHPGTEAQPFIVPGLKAGLAL